MTPVFSSEPFRHARSFARRARARMHVRRVGRRARPAFRRIARALCLLLGLAGLTALLVGCGGAGGDDEPRKSAWILTRVVVPHGVQVDDLRIRDVDTDTLYTAGAGDAQPILLRVKEGRYRFKTLKATLPSGEEPKFQQPDRPLEIFANCVNYIGDVVITSRRDGYRLVVQGRLDTVELAMAQAPEFYETRPVLVVLGDQKPKRLRFEGREGIHGTRKIEEEEEE